MTNGKSSFDDQVRCKSKIVPAWVSGIRNRYQRSRTTAGLQKAGKVVVVSHVRAPGPSVHLVSALTKRYDQILEIEHPLEPSRSNVSKWRLWHGDEIVGNGTICYDVPAPIRYVCDVVVTLWWTATKLRRIDLFIGLGALDGCTGLIVRILGYSEKAVTWLIDYSPQRFSSMILNKLYRTVDTIAALWSDETWNISAKVMSVHQEGHWRYRVARFSNIQKVVPVGVDRILDPCGIRRQDELIFIGHILEKQGLQLVIDSFPMVSALRPGLHLIVLGDGPYLCELRKRVSELGLGAAVEFRGFISDDDEVWQALSQASIGLATYLNLDNSFTHYADPGKIKQYLAAGLPICMTEVPSIALDVQARGCGVVVVDNVVAVAGGILELLDEVDLVDRRRACIEFASEFTWDYIFRQALDEGI